MIRDYCDLYDPEEGDDEEPVSQPTCRSCGKTDLHWEKVGDKWKLFESVGLRLREHKCNHLNVMESFDE